MKKSTLKISIIIFMICVSGCAVTYQPINPPSLEYNSHDMQDGIELSYKYDVLQKVGNRKYAKKKLKAE